MRFVFAPTSTVRPPVPSVSEFTPEPSMMTGSVLPARNVTERIEKSCPSVALTSPPGAIGETKNTSSPLPGSASGAALVFNCEHQLIPPKPVLVFHVRPLAPAQHRL